MSSSFSDLIRVEVDPALPSRTAFIRTGDEQAIMDTTSAGIMQDPVFAEDLASLSESIPFLIRFRRGTGTITCECCGTKVFAVPESEYVTPRRWQQAIWEPDTGRKHTLRRCEALRGRAGQP